MKTFQQFITEAELKDKEGLGHGTGMTHRGGEKIGSDRKKTAPEKKRVKAVGGGKTAPAKDYKPRKDIGTQKPRSKREQQPEKERGSAALSAKEAQRKAYRERKARESGAKTKTASELLSKKTKPKTDPNYKPKKASGYTAAERKSITRKGERVLRDIVLKSTGKKSEKELKHPISSSGYKYRKKD
jgi:hypothetical protein